MSNPAVICQNLIKSFGHTTVLHDISFSVPTGQIIALLGPSGCGKTTTLRLIAGFERLDQGQIEIGGQIVTDGRRHLPPEKRHIGMVFQDYAIFPHLSVADNIRFGLGRDKDGPARAQEMLDFVGLPGIGAKMPQELSGGQQQRIALARALAPRPTVILLDEPFSNLDAKLRLQVRTEVRSLLKKSGTTAIFVTHDQEEALYLGDRIGVMNDGYLEQMGTPEQVYHRPQTHFVAQFMGKTDLIPGTITPLGITTPLGPLPLDQLNQSLSLPPNTVVTVATRPDDIFIYPDQPPNARITDVHFQGISRLYCLQVDDGGPALHSWQPHTLDLSPGTAVRVGYRPGHTLTCFYQQRAFATYTPPPVP
ncbi:MAG TPA: ABC transporter ATP-binding protein [Anaerolineae bacterium]|nr:ABC transporter ATP-binding protein [Anaerolineae bacterium]